MFVEQKLDVPRLGKPTLHRAWLSKCAMHAFAQLLVDPLLNRNAKALLRAVEDFGGHEIADCAPKDMFSLEALHFHRSRNARADKFDQFVIKQGYPRFQRHCHAHPINFGQNVSRQIGFAVEIKQRIERIVRA